MEIKKIKETFELTQKLTDRKSILIPILAKKLRMSDIELMSFINNNPKLFVTQPTFSYKKVTKKSSLWGGKETFKWVDYEKNKNLGLGVSNVYIKPEDNYRTEEWLQVQILEQSKYLHITESDNYGYIQGYYLNKDEEDDKYRTHLWRNTLEKLTWLKDNNYIGETSFVYGGFGDSYTSKYPYGISLGAIEELKKLGWTFNEFKPLSQ
jgi:hypothetical protein